jgi:flap endonuclease-1
MGIPKLNKLLLERCPNSITKIHVGKLQDKKIAVDISIYLYKFLTDGDYMEHLYLFLSVFKYYCIVPIFIFDGKPPVEKQALLKRRYSEKQQAYQEYTKIEQNMSLEMDLNKIEEMQETLKFLKKKMIRITNTHIDQAIELITAFGYQHYFAPHEADQLCVYLTVCGKTYATLSDDMDMIVSGCPIVLRNLNLMSHDVYLYNTTHILNDLEVSLHDFRDIVVLSGTDYEISNKPLNISIRKAFDYYKKYKDANISNGFYTWLIESGIIIENEELHKISCLLNIDNYKNELDEFIRKHINPKPKFSVSMIKTIMKQYKFIFVI